MSILKQRIARRLRHEGNTDESVKNLSLGGCHSMAVLHPPTCCPVQRPAACLTNLRILTC